MKKYIWYDLRYAAVAKTAIEWQDLKTHLWGDASCAQAYIEFIYCKFIAL